MSDFLQDIFQLSIKTWLRQPFHRRIEKDNEDWEHSFVNLVFGRQEIEISEVGKFVVYLKAAYQQMVKT